MFSRKLIAGWADMDFNSHMRNTAYLDKSADLRMMYFAANGFPMVEFSRQRFGPVVQSDEINYFREINLLEEFDVYLELAGISADGSRFRLRNRFVRDNGKASAVVTSLGGWLDLSARQLREPPPALLEAMLKLERTEDFEELPGLSG